MISGVARLFLPEQVIGVGEGERWCNFPQVYGHVLTRLLLSSNHCATLMLVAK